MRVLPPEEGDGDWKLLVLVLVVIVIIVVALAQVFDFHEPVYAPTVETLEPIGG